MSFLSPFFNQLPWLQIYIYFNSFERLFKIFTVTADVFYSKLTKHYMFAYIKHYYFRLLWVSCTEVRFIIQAMKLM